MIARAVFRPLFGAALCLLAAGAAAAGPALTRPKSAVEAMRTYAVTENYGAMRPDVVRIHPRPARSDWIRPRLGACLRDGALLGPRVDLSAYDWPGTRPVEAHQLCLFAIFDALGDPASVQAWVEAVIAPAARPGCPARWGVAEESVFGPTVVNVWRPDRRLPLFIGVMDRAALWSEGLRQPVHSRLRTTFDEGGRPVIVEYDEFTIGARYGLARCP